MLYDFICVPGNGAFYGDMISPDDSLELFSRGHALFCPSALSGGEMLRNYDVEYGILPNPKYEEDQDGYYTTCQDYFSIMAVTRDLQRYGIRRNDNRSACGRELPQCR